MSYLIPEGTYITCFMTDTNGFTSEAETVVGEDVLFEEHDRLLLTDILQASNAFTNYSLYREYHLFHSTEMGNWIVAAPKECVREL